MNILRFTMGLVLTLAVMTLITGALLQVAVRYIGPYRLGFKAAQLIALIYLVIVVGVVAIASYLIYLTSYQGPFLPWIPRAITVIAGTLTFGYLVRDDDGRALGWAKGLLVAVIVVVVYALLAWGFRSGGE